MTQSKSFNNKTESLEDAPFSFAQELRDDANEYDKGSYAQELRNDADEYDKELYASWERYFTTMYSSELILLETKCKELASMGRRSYEFPVMFRYYSEAWQNGWIQKFFSDVYGFTVKHSLDTIERDLNLNLNSNSEPFVKVMLRWD
jgi:hypothetical protein